MISGQLRETREGYVVVIPREEVERLSLRGGDSVEVELRKPAAEKLPPDVRAAFEESWKRNQAGYRYLAGR
jgi:hypothetical protein